MKNFRLLTTSALILGLFVLDSWTQQVQPGQPVQPIGVQPGGPQPVSPAQSSGCTFDPNCFFYAHGCTLAKCPPFNRTTPVSCNQCIQMCTEKQSSEYPYFCRSIAYDCVTQTCDMFAVDENGGGVLAKDPNKFYFRPTGQCKGAPAPVGSCPAGQVPKMIAVKDSQSSGISGQNAPGVDQLGCAQACLKNQLPGGAAIDCKSAQFKGGQCTLATSQATAENQIQPDPGSSYFQKFCFDAASVVGCPDVFDEYPQKVLIGQSRQIVDSTSLQDCVQQCLNAKTKFGFGCNSAEFYYNVKTQNCIINDETRSSRPDLFTDIKDDKVTYIETLCGGPPGTAGPIVNPPNVTPAPIGPIVVTTLGPGITPPTIGSLGTLGTLGTLAPSDGTATLGFLPPAHRSVLAEKKKEAFDKAFKDDRSSAAVCRALVYNGLKKCPIGVMSQGNRMRYCVRPVDC